MWPNLQESANQECKYSVGLDSPIYTLVSVTLMKMRKFSLRIFFFFRFFKKHFRFRASSQVSFFFNNAAGLMWPAMFIYITAKILRIFYFRFPLLQCGFLLGSFTACTKRCSSNYQSISMIWKKYNLCRNLLQLRYF